jgi:hypothetical protein
MIIAWIATLSWNEINFQCEEPLNFASLPIGIQNRRKIINETKESSPWRTTFAWSLGSEKRSARKHVNSQNFSLVWARLTGQCFCGFFWLVFISMLGGVSYNAFPVCPRFPSLGPLLIFRNYREFVHLHRECDKRRTMHYRGRRQSDVWLLLWQLHTRDSGVWDGRYLLQYWLLPKWYHFFLWHSLIL